jgi:hypothetical protein
MSSAMACDANESVSDSLQRGLGEERGGQAAEEKVLPEINLPAAGDDGDATQQGMIQ